MPAELQFVEIPGFADAIKREVEVRRSAYSNAVIRIAGVAVRKITLRDMLALEEMRNGFFVPFKFETRKELFGHSAQLVWWLSDCPKLCENYGRLEYFTVIGKRAALIKHLGKFPDELIDGVKQYLDDAFMDAPKGSGGGASHASGPAYILDAFASGGYTYTFDQIANMPLVQLWQLLRLIHARLCGGVISNPSDKIACDYLAKQSAAGGKN